MLNSYIIFIFGFTALFLCGIGDWLIGYEPPGGTPLIFGISSTSIADVPVWFYIVSLGFGILSGFGCMVFGPAMVEVLEKNGISRETKMFRLFRFGMKSAPLSEARLIKWGVLDMVGYYQYVHVNC